MQANTELKEQILNSRKMSTDGKVVEYDLTSGVDFSKPRETAEALAEVFYQQDVSKWFNRNDGKLDFGPPYSARILVNDEHDKAAARAVDDFLKDLKKDEIRKEYAEDIAESANARPGLPFLMFGGVMNYVIMEAIERSEQKRKFVRDLMAKISSNTEIQTSA